jgi:hypothetical protein
MGELASFRGLKFRITFKILLAICGRVRIRVDMEFKVASTRTASLRKEVSWAKITRRHNLPAVFLKY